MSPAAVFLLISLGIWLYGFRVTRSVERYEFEHRTEGGVVQFSDFKASKRHNRKRAWGEFCRKVGILLAVVTGVIWFLYAMNRANV